MAVRIFGEIPGFFEGYIFNNRLELASSGVHKPLQAGISGSQSEGADSILLAGGYEDDEDYGDVIYYTGFGGRDINTGKQISNQELVRQNRALTLNCAIGLPVRVIRGAKHQSEFSPKVGFRYEGLYRVEGYYRKKGRKGFYVWMFKLVKDRPLPLEPVIGEPREEYRTTRRVETNIQRIIRDTVLSRQVKQMYNYTCQVCREQVLTNAGPYAEAAHIHPLGKPHNGPDTLSNLLCLCPNHHVMFDFGGLAIMDNLELLGVKGRLYVLPKHRVNVEFLAYHREHFFQEH